MAASAYISLADLCRRTNCDHAMARAILDSGGYRYWMKGRDPMLTVRTAARVGRELKKAAEAKRAKRAALIALPGLECVYFIKDGAFVKIGAALDARQRLAELQVANPRLLTLLFVLNGGFSEEARLQDRFWDHRERGEWFRIEGELAAFIEAKMQDRDTESHGNPTAPALNDYLVDTLTRIRPVI